MGPLGVVIVSLFSCISKNTITEPVFSWGVFLFISCAWVILPLRHCYIHGCTNIFVLIIPMFKVIHLHNLSNLILGCTSFLDDIYIYIMYMFYSATAPTSSLTWVHTILLTHLCLNLTKFSNELKYTSLFPISQYIIYLLLLWSF